MIFFMKVYEIGCNFDFVILVIDYFVVNYILKL